MAIKIYDKFAPRANPADGDYPYGSIKNESVPGAKDGTPLDAVWGNDYAGFDAALLAEAGDVPNGVPDTATSSQRLSAILKILRIYTGVTFAKVGISTSNTASQNTTALNTLRTTTQGVRLCLPTGDYAFDVFNTNGLAEVFGDGKANTVISLEGTTSPVMVQPGPILHSGLWFKSIAGSLELSRIGMVNYTVLKDCKVSGFIHTSAAPNAWGCYFKNVTGCRLYNVEFDDNSQSDLAILEGTTDLKVKGCFHTSGELVVNFEPNYGTPAQNGIEISNSNIFELYLQCNDLLTKPEDVATVKNCTVDTLFYDGLGVTFVNTKIKAFVQSIDNQSRNYGANISGLAVEAKEYLPDTMLANVGHTGSGCSWTLRASTAAPVDRYNRLSSGELVVGVNNVAASTLVVTNNIKCLANTPYLFTICKELLAGGSRPNIILVEFKNIGGSIISSVYLARNLSIGVQDRHQHILVPPSDTDSFSISVYGGDTATTYQSVAYQYISVRKISVINSGIDSSSLGYATFNKRVKLPVTKSQFDAVQYYIPPLPVGTEVEFAFASAASRLAVVTIQGADATSKLGTLQAIATYP